MNSGSPNDAQVWIKNFEQWWSGAVADAPPQMQDVLKRVLDMGKVYLGLAEQLHASHSSSLDEPGIERWLRSLEAGFDGWFQRLEQGKSATEGFGIGSSLFSGWQQVISSLPGMDAFRDVGVSGLHMPNSGAWQEYLRQAATPGLGVDADWQADLKRLAGLALGYQQALDIYLEAYARHGKAAVANLRGRLEALAESGKQVSSLRELYDLWVDVSEEEYGRFAISSGYQKTYADLVNAMLALKKAGNAMLDQRMRKLGLPGRADLEAALRVQQELRRENRVLRQRLLSLEQRLVALEQAAGGLA